MDIEDIESTLHALRKLYGLLGKDGEIAQDCTSNMLDDKSRLLLKHLLDTATEKAFKAHREVLEAGQDGGLSMTQYSSTQSLKLNDAQNALQNQSKIFSPVVQNSGNDLDKSDYKYCKIANQETPTQPMPPGYGNRNRSCRICKRRIAEHSTLYDPKAGPEIISLHQLNNEIENLPESSSRTLEKEKQEGLDGLDMTATGSMLLYRPAIPATNATEEFQVADSLSEEASDVIKQIELCIQNLKIYLGTAGLPTSASSPMDNVAENELSHRISDFVPKAEMAKSPVAKGSEWGQIEYCDSESGEPLYQMVNEQHRDLSTQRQAPSKTICQQIKMKLANEDSVQPLKYNSPGSMVSPESHRPSQREDTVHVGQSVKSIIAKIESLNQAMQNEMMPRKTCNFKYLSPSRYMNSVTLTAPVTCLPNQFDNENLHEKKSVLGAISRTPGARQPSRQSSISGDYLVSGRKIQTEDNSTKMNQNQSWKAQSQTNLPFQVFEGRTDLENCKTPPQYSTRNPKWMDEEQIGNPKRKDRINLRRRISRHEREYENTSWNSSSSNWGSQQAGTSGSESEEKYFPGWRKHRKKYVSPSPRSKSWVYSTRRGRHQWHHRDTSSSLDEYSSTISDRDRGYDLTSTSGNESDETPEYSWPTSVSSHRFSSTGDNESKEYSLHDQPRCEHHKQQPRYLQRNLKSEKTGSTRFCKNPKVINPKKQVGTWKKLKDKLSFIFHHHHHHHHHRHRLSPDEGDRDASDHNSSRGKHLLKWKRKKSTPTSVRLEEGYGEQEAEKVGKPFGNVVIQHRNQGHHFNGLVGGLFRHIRHSKKSELSAKKFKHLGKLQHEGKKVWTKQHWWQQMLQRRKKKLGLGYK